MPSDEERRLHALPAIEDDDLEADLVPPDHAPLPLLDRAKVEQQWKKGRKAEPASYLKVLRTGSMRDRLFAAELLFFRSGGARLIRSGPTGLQLRDMAALESGP